MPGRTMEFEINEEERIELLDLARSAIRDAIVGDGSLRATLDGLTITPVMRTRTGLFVTLKTPGEPGEPPGGRLRGCIGLMSSEGPLYRTVIETAPKAALNDPRFPPLTAEELPDVRLSLSILSPMKELRDPEALELGRHGLQLVRGTHRSVFLPQVPVEQGWDLRRYLEQLASKAGLDRDGWRGATLSTFETVSFGDPD